MSRRPKKRSWLEGPVGALAAAMVLLIVLGALLPSGPAGAAPPRTWVVNPGESITAVVERASSGDTIKIGAGVYREAICVVGKGLAIVGAGSGPAGTRIVWPDWTTPDDLPPVEPTPCWDAESAAAPGSDQDLRDDVSGLFILNPDRPVTVRGLSTRNHPANGVAAWGADGFQVERTAGSGHGRHGILAADSTSIRIASNVEVGSVRGSTEQPRVGTAGISVADSDGARAHIAGNEVQGYGVGVFVRESRDGSVFRNTVTDNCIGILVFDDALTVVPTTERNVQGGDWRVTRNTAVANNRACTADAGEVAIPARFSGTGMSVVNADDIRIHRNDLIGNAPAVLGPDLPSAGLSLLSVPLPNNPLGTDPGPVEFIDVAGNRIEANVPVDVLLSSPLVSDSLLSVGEGIEFRGNLCDSSIPPGICSP